ncbi:MAG: hypothetical protein ACR2RE_26130, partial [Geminicoccaceae bacterium]
SPPSRLTPLRHVSGTAKLQADIPSGCLVRAASVMRQAAQDQTGNDRDDEGRDHTGDEGFHIKALPEHKIRRATT